MNSLKTKAYDKDNNVIKCDKCDKDAGYSIMGVNKQMNLCKEHSPYANSQPATFVYIPNKKDNE